MRLNTELHGKKRGRFALQLDDFPNMRVGPYGESVIIPPPPESYEISDIRRHSVELLIIMNCYE